MNRRVFLPTNCDRFDVSLASCYGEMEVLCSQRLNPFRVDECVEAFSQELDEKFDPDNDFICMTGQTLLISIALGVAMTKFDRVNVLLYDAISSSYKSRIITMKGNRNGKD